VRDGSGLQGQVVGQARRRDSAWCANDPGDESDRATRDGSLLERRDHNLFKADILEVSALG
jgi:hypothetical protein